MLRYTMVAVVMLAMAGLAGADTPLPEKGTAGKRPTAALTQLSKATATTAASWDWDDDYDYRWHSRKFYSYWEARAFKRRMEYRGYEVRLRPHGYHYHVYYRYSPWW